MSVRRMVLLMVAAAAAAAGSIALAAELTDVNAALSEAAKSGKPAMVIFQGGKKTKFEDGLDNADVKTVMDKFVVARVNAAGKKDLIARFNLNENKLPTILFLGPGGLELGSQECGDPKKMLDSKRFVPTMNNVLKGYPEKVKPLLAKKAKDLPNFDAAQQAALLTVFAENKYTEAGDAIVKLAGDNKTPAATRAACLKTLAAFGEEKFYPPVIAALESKDKELLAAAKEALSAPAASKALIAALGNESADIRAAAYLVAAKAYGPETGAKPASFWKTGDADARAAQIKVIEEHIAKKIEKLEAKTKK